MRNHELIWYVGYGSNLSEERFNCYISGGTPKYGVKNHIGCRDKNPFVKKSTMTIPYELYFAETSSSWENKAVAFIRPVTDHSVHTICTCYLIQKEQLTDIFFQENDKDPFAENTSYDLLNTKFNEGFKQYQQENKWYGKIISLGLHKSYPAATFTTNMGEESIKCDAPGAKYLKTIIEGIKSHYSYTQQEIADYLCRRCGINGNINSKELEQLICSTA